MMRWDSMAFPLLGFAAVFGGFLLQFTMGSFYSFGNIMTYMVSYMRQNGSPNLTYTDFVVVQSTWGMTQGVVMPMSGFIINLIGPKLAMVIGSTIFSAGCALTYFTISKKVWMVALTYGFVSAFGQNIALIPTLTTAMKWFPDRKGTAMGIVVGGFGGGALAFNQIQTAIINPNNIAVMSYGPDKGYFVDEEVLGMVPTLLLILGGIYLIMGLLACILIVQPPDDWLHRQALQKEMQTAPAITLKENFDKLEPQDQEGPEDKQDESSLNNKPTYVVWKRAIRRKEFFLLWVTRLSVVLITQVVSALYKAFGMTFIYDDRFLSMVGAISSFFNCSGRLLYGFIMDKSSYRIGMIIEASLLTLLVSTFYLTSLVDGNTHTDDPAQNASDVISANFSLENCQSLDNVSKALNNGHSSYNLSEAKTTTVTPSFCDDSKVFRSTPETSMLAKGLFALWVWAIYLTFPGTYSMQPAVTAQTFGHRDAGTIYAFLFSADIVNNLMVATMSKILEEKFGYLGLFLIVSAWGVLALVATLFFPKKPCPGKDGKIEELPSNSSLHNN